MISVDSVRAYKPHRSCYAFVEAPLGVPKEQVLFVSANSFDAVGAKALGFEVAWIRRSGGSVPVTMFGMLRGRAPTGKAPSAFTSVDPEGNLLRIGSPVGQLKSLWRNPLSEPSASLTLCVALIAATLRNLCISQLQ